MKHEFLFELLSTAGISGCERTIQRKAASYMSNFADEVQVGLNGNVIGILNPNSPCRILLDGHIDEIGLMVTAYTKEGYLRVAKTGGIYPRMYPGHKVRVYTETGILYGAVVNAKELQNKEDMKEKDLMIDIGAKNAEDASAHIPIGAMVIFDTDWRPLLNNRIASRAIDNRSGAYIVMESMKRAKERGCKNGIYSVTTVGEETAYSGGAWAGAQIKPTVGIVVDVTFASDVPDGDEGVRGRICLDGGPGLCIGTLAHPVMVELLRESAKRTGITVQPVITPGRSFTDMDVLHISGEGVPTAMVHLPVRYMHTPAEVCSLKDIEDCIELISEFLCMVNEQTNLKLITL